MNWEFIREVLTWKGFESGFIHRIMQLVSGGQTAVSINRVTNVLRRTEGKVASPGAWEHDGGYDIIPQYFHEDHGEP